MDDTNQFMVSVAKIDAGMAILLTPSFHIIEFPSVLLPNDATAGSIIDISVHHNKEEEIARETAFDDVQKEIFETYGQKLPSPPVLKLKNATQTSIVLEWDPLQLSTARLKSLCLYRNNVRVLNISNPMTTHNAKLSGLSLDTEYDFSLVLDTTAGTFPSKHITIKTLRMIDLTGIQVCVGNMVPNEMEALQKCIERIHARPIQTSVRIDTTHFICSSTGGPEYEKAKAANIPILGLDYLLKCESEGRLVNVSGFYIENRASYNANASINSVEAAQNAAPNLNATTEQPKNTAEVAQGAASAKAPQQTTQQGTQNSANAEPSSSASVPAEAPETEAEQSIDVSSDIGLRSDSSKPNEAPTSSENIKADQPENSTKQENPEEDMQIKDAEEHSNLESTPAAQQTSEVEANNHQEKPSSLPAVEQINVNEENNTPETEGLEDEKEENNTAAESLINQEETTSGEAVTKSTVESSANEEEAEPNEIIEENAVKSLLNQEGPATNEEVEKNNANSENANGLTDEKIIEAPLDTKENSDDDKPSPAAAEDIGTNGAIEEIPQVSEVLEPEKAHTTNLQLNALDKEEDLNITTVKQSSEPTADDNLIPNKEAEIIQSSDEFESVNID
ncbi:Cell fusion protein cfr1 [Schizosaccharomyces pombe]|uniref:Cell fusion protein cfr1 n=1 Tax=Schizosaccharomyces pombe (strain 972 / ATCC 24843) TaxID=284812 RepID=CFR1_SCHPO|nr:CHS5-like protein Cfr1 [Schizosaccharomyces pombe]Q92357.1 RecName: Full=Cell fusion protein cfr1; AltName: Full=CHS5-related protein 1 [Schizosaccharomyces pombe 972h-]CAB03614.1 Chs five related protein Cfr1 [Schizosaccharomyces pombe]|eukprot:NP_594121.1 CHS5-like protein Cfr1 [Schizosaccharomyces pombe]